MRFDLAKQKTFLVGTKRFNLLVEPKRFNSFQTRVRLYTQLKSMQYTYTKSGECFSTRLFSNLIVERLVHHIGL